MLDLFANTPASGAIQCITQGGIAITATTKSQPAILAAIPQSSTDNAIAFDALNNSESTPDRGRARADSESTAYPPKATDSWARPRAPEQQPSSARQTAWRALRGGVLRSGALGGSLTVVGGAKSAAVPHPDGSHRRLYCLESPESWFEDFGTGRLECGRAQIPIDPDFAAMVDLSDDHVFLAESGRHHALAVTSRTPAGFVVEADTTLATLKGRKDVDLTGTFSWRVVARRRDIRAERLATVTIPPEPALPAPPHVPASTKRGP